MNICVFCSASSDLDEKYYRLGYEFGKLIGETGNSLVYGGHAAGIMEKVAEAVSMSGGRVTGVVPKVFQDGISAFADDVICVESMGERKSRMEALSDAIAVLPGGIGTMDEFFDILVQKSLGYHSKPIAVYNMDGFYDGLVNMLSQFERMGFMKDGAYSNVCFFDNPHEMIEYLIGGK